MLSTTLISDAPPPEVPEVAPLSFWQKYKWAIIESAVGVAVITTAVMLYRRRSTSHLGNLSETFKEDEWDLQSWATINVKDYNKAAAEGNFPNMLEAYGTGMFNLGRLYQAAKDKKYRNTPIGLKTEPWEAEAQAAALEKHIRTAAENAKQATRKEDDRAPRPPEELVDALQDRVHPTSGRLLAVTPIRPKR